MYIVAILLLALSVLSFGVTTGEAQENTEKYEASNIIDVNGVSLHYAVVGEGKPVVLVHQYLRLHRSTVPPRR